MVNDLKQKGDNTYKKNIFLISHTSFSSGGFVIRLVLATDFNPTTFVQRSTFNVHRSRDFGI